jgi:hypothetical protein
LRSNFRRSGESSELFDFVRVKKAPFGPYLRSNIPRSALCSTLDTYNFLHGFFSSSALKNNSNMGLDGVDHYSDVRDITRHNDTSFSTVLLEKDPNFNETPRQPKQQHEDSLIAGTFRTQLNS